MKTEDDDNDEQQEPAPPRTKKRRVHILEDDDDEGEENDAFNTPESSGERAIFITQQDPKPYHELGTLSRSQKGKTVVHKKKLLQPLTSGSPLA